MWWSRRTMRLPVTASHSPRSHEGQAIVELALMITFMFLLMGAAVDMGLMYKSYQTLVNASAEASTYLDYEPRRPCAPPCDAIAEADAEARRRFRTEQGDTIGRISSTLDLDSNGVDDYTQSGGVDMVRSMVKIDEADNTQIDDAGDGKFALQGTFDTAATDVLCQQRTAVPLSLTNPLVTSCYIVIRAEMIYRPFLLRPVLGDERRIRVISVRRIVK